MEETVKGKSQIKSGIFLSYLTMIIHNVVNLVYTPIMIRTLGQSEYGLYGLVSAFISYLGLLSFGFDNTYLRYYSQYRHTESNEKIKSLNGMFLTIFSIIGAVAFIVGAICAQNARTVLGDKLTASEIDSAKILMFLLAINIGITFPCNLFRIYISANEKFVLPKIISLITTFVNPLVTLPLLLLGYGSIVLVSVSLGLTVLTNIIFIFYCFKKLGLRFSFKKFDFKIFKGIAVFSFFVFLGEIVDEINWHLDKFILGRISGTIEVAIYSVAASLCVYFRSFSSSISSVFSPRVNKIVSLNEGNDALTNLMIKVGRVQFLVLSLVATGFVFCGQAFCKLWVGEEYSRSYLIALVLILPSIIPLIQNIGVSILTAKAKHKFRSVAYFLIALFNVGLSIPLGMKWGGLGCAIGTGISLILGNGIVINIYYKKIGLNIKKFWLSILSMCKGLILPVLVGAVIMHFISDCGWLVLIAFILGYSLIFFLSMWFMGMDNYEKNLFNTGFRKIKSIFVKRKNDASL